MSAGVSIRNLTKRYGAVTAVDGVSIDVRPGDIFGLLGPNGAGKTTTLECLLGLRQPDTGTITIDGVDIIACPDVAKDFVGAVLQTTALQDKITPRQALRLFAALHRRTATEAEALLSRFGLEPKASAPFETLSGGQRQRLALALAFLNVPRLLVLDEPTAGLDPIARRELQDLVREHRAAGCTVLLSTHQLDEAHRLCDHLAIIDAGRIVATGSPDELIARADATARVFVRAKLPLTAARLGSLAAVTHAGSRGDGWMLASRDANATTIALAQFLAGTENALIELQIIRPSLEDAFLALTGRAWNEAGQLGVPTNP